MTRWKLSLAAIGAMCCALLSGCGTGTRSAPPLDTTFDRSATDARRSPHQDRSGALQYDSARSDTADRPAAPEAPARPPMDANGANGMSGAGGENDRPSTNVSPVVQSQIRTPREQALARAGMTGTASSMPAVNDAQRGVGDGQVMLLGAVVVDVNGKPIFVNDVFRTIAPVLHARAQDLDERRYRKAAETEIQRQVIDLIRDELQYAAADRSLDSSEKRMADMLTAVDRENFIRRSGGSEQLARQATAAQGVEFDQLLEDRRRWRMRQVYFQKRELPLIQITADDMRQYYARHLNDLFTERPQAQFRVIKIDVRRTGSESAARDKAMGILQRARAGEDFAAIAGSVNDDPFLMRNKGDVTGNGGWMDKDAYANDKVEEAVWALHPGQVSDVVETPEAFYIAKLENKKTGRVKSFDEQAVQTQCRDALETEQMAALQERMTQRLMKDAIIYPDPPRLEPVIEIAMQKYREWAPKK